MNYRKQSQNKALKAWLAGVKILIRSNALPSGKLGSKELQSSIVSISRNIISSTEFEATRKMCCLLEVYNCTACLLLTFYSCAFPRPAVACNCFSIGAEEGSKFDRKSGRSCQLFTRFGIRNKNKCCHSKKVVYSLL